jgi:hypothetical protein
MAPCRSNCCRRPKCQKLVSEAVIWVFPSWSFFSGCGGLMASRLVKSSSLRQKCNRIASFECLSIHQVSGCEFMVKGIPAVTLDVVQRQDDTTGIPAVASAVPTGKAGGHRRFDPSVALTPRVYLFPASREYGSRWDKNRRPITPRLSSALHLWCPLIRPAWRASL